MRALPFVQAALKHGYEVEFTWTGHPTREAAITARRGLFNAARLVGVSVSAEPERSPGKHGPYLVRFTLHDKRTGRAYIVAKHGPDRSAWPYDTRGR